MHYIKDGTNLFCWFTDFFGNSRVLKYNRVFHKKIKCRFFSEINFHYNNKISMLKTVVDNKKLFKNMIENKPHFRKFQKYAIIYEVIVHVYICK